MSIKEDPISLFHSIILGVIQGVTEFLPVSSSGHLVILQGLFGVEEPKLFFNVMLHLGTLIAIIMVFWRDIREIPEGIFAALRGNPGMGGFSPALWRCPQGRLVILIVVGSIPAALMGFLFEETFSRLFGFPIFAGFMLMVTGTVLWFTRTRPSGSRGIGETGVIDALIVGDIGLISMIRDDMGSDTSIYASTLLGAMNYEAADYIRELGVQRVVLERQVSVQEIGAIVRCNQDVEIEVFVHGGGCSHINANC